MMAQGGSEMNALVLVCGNVFDGISDSLTGPAEILVNDNTIAEIERSVERPPGARVIDLSERTVSPGFIDTHVHLTMDAANLAVQTLESAAAEALKGLNIARQYMNYGFTSLRDLAVHTGAAEGCKQAIHCGARSIEHAYLIDAEGIDMAEKAGAYIVPTMQMTQEDMQALQAGSLPAQGVWKFRRDNERILASQRLLAASGVKVAYGTDCGMFPFSRGILEFQAMVNAGLSSLAP
jgi:imidazolonepropionase-like amidohydrolase